MILPVRLGRMGYQCLEDFVVNIKRRKKTDENLISKSQLEERLRLSMEWLKLTHKVTGFNGSSQGFSYLFGWRDAFPETTGYVAKTFIEYANFSSEEFYLKEGLQMLDYLCEIQRDDGGIIQGLVNRSEMGVSIIFNAGMAMSGWLKGYEVTKDDKYLDALHKAGEFLVRIRSDQKLWLKHSYQNILHTYHARVAWFLLGLSLITDKVEYKETAIDIYEWVLAQQMDNGYFKNCIFRLDRPTYNTHGFAYTVRGLLEGFLILNDERYLEAAKKTSYILLKKFEANNSLPTLFNENWEPECRSECLTGIAQLSIIWFKLYLITKDDRFLNGGIKGTDLLCTLQNTKSKFKEIRGAIKGSHPIYGRYAPLQYPNWATKFFADALMHRIRITNSSNGEPGEMKRVFV